ncbi:MAG: deoxyguanosinetriphosphate triphosphohydrolase [Lachnospiraceae bacterium]|nr:deoxyguanosinetriphosphate triphosphohydrolase [Lachnospiraceae bacterium]MBQ9934530.1 deoxyguanosinetriphosphate triphosphohydrolase [Lachnospiraceae bacterium]
MNIREEQELREHKLYRSCASFSDETKGRDVYEEPCDIRTDYQRDRDRIIHSKSFRRLKHKTQVFLSPGGDHYRTRLTHTLEVAQIARTIAKALCLNEDLTEAIALGHDLGHTPFGHAGERALSKYTSKPFHHNEQSVRVVEKLEKNGIGLNLTWEVRDGILNHRSAYKPSTLEGAIVRISDKIAYVNHDIDDGIRAGILSEEQLPGECTKILGNCTRDRINNTIHALVNYSKDKDLVALPPEFEQAQKELRFFMFEDLYTNPVAKSQEAKAEQMIGLLYEKYINNIEKLPAEFQEYISAGENKEIVVCDYIAGMTDNYAIECFNELFIPKSW